MDPLEITILKCGTVARFVERTGQTLRRINPPAYELMALLEIQQEDYRTDWREMR